MKRMTIVSIVLGFMCGVSPVFTAGLKKVLVLDFINIDKNPNYDYLEGSITEAVQKSLKDKFAFRETPESKWKEIAKQNYIYRDEFWTRTAAMNLGLFAKQDVVISGGFRSIGKKKKAKIRTTVRIMDIAKRKVLSEFDMEMAVDSNIFTSIDKIAKRITEEAKSILPAKGDWDPTMLEEESNPLFSKVGITIQAGAGVYALGYAENLEPLGAPAFTGSLWAHMPSVSPSFGVSLNSALFFDKVSVTKTPNLKGTETTTQNVFLGGSTFWDMDLAADWLLRPKFGAGYIFQKTSLRGVVNTDLANGFPAAVAGGDLLYSLSKQVDVGIGLNVFVEIDKKITLYNMLTLGVDTNF